MYSIIDDPLEILWDCRILEGFYDHFWWIFRFLKDFSRFLKDFSGFCISFEELFAIFKDIFGIVDHFWRIMRFAKDFSVFLRDFWEIWDHFLWIFWRFKGFLGDLQAIFSAFWIIFEGFFDILKDCWIIQGIFGIFSGFFWIRDHFLKHVRFSKDFQDFFAILFVILNHFWRILWHFEGFAGFFGIFWGLWVIFEGLFDFQRIFRIYLGVLRDFLGDLGSLLKDSFKILFVCWRKHLSKYTSFPAAPCCSAWQLIKKENGHHKQTSGEKRNSTARENH